MDGKAIICSSYSSYQDTLIDQESYFGSKRSYSFQSRTFLESRDDIDKIAHELAK